MKKKFLSMLLVTVMVFSTVLPATVFAASTVNIGLDASDNEVKAGDEITATVNIGAYSDLDSFTIRLYYDKTKLEVKSYVDGTPTGGFGTFNPTGDGFVGAAAMYTNAISSSANAKIFSVTFKVLDEAVVGDTTIKITGTNESAPPSASNWTGSGSESATITGTHSKTISIVEELPTTINVTGITAPAKGMAPATTLTNATNTTATMEWYQGNSKFTGGTFAANTAYTAKVTITPATGYTFSSGATYQINSKTATVTDGVDGAKVLSYTFPKTASKTLTSIAIGTQPTNKTYVHGDTLDTAGMVVTATYDDSSTANITADCDISYTGVESYLKNGETTATVTYGGKTATVSDLTVSAKDVTITGATAENKAYDGNNTATVGGTPVVSDKIGSDDVTVNPGTATFDNQFVGTGKTVTFSGYTLSGDDAGNYNLTAQPTATANITAIADPVAVTGTASVTKGGQTVNLSSNVSGNQGDVSYAVTAGEGSVNVSSGVYTSPDASGSATVTVTVADKDLGGSADAEYTGTSKTIIVTITDKETATISNFDNANITYGETYTPNATADHGTITYIYSDGMSGIDGTTDAGTYTVKAVAEDATHYGEKTITVTVNAKDVTITGATAENKAYDGNNTATVSGTLAVAGKINSDDVTATAGTATFDDQYVGTGKAVTFDGYALSGAKAGNYNLTAQPTATIANITDIADPVVVTDTATVTKGGQTVDLSNNVSGNKGDVSYAVTTGAGAVDASTGIYTSPDATGSATVTVTVADKDMGGTGDVEYTGTTKDIAITISDKLTQTISLATAGPVEKIYSDADFSNVATVTTGDGAVTYASDDATVATVDENGKVTITGDGTATITATAAETTDYAEATASYDVVVAKGTITITADDISAYKGATEPTYTYKVTGLRAGESLETIPTVAGVSVDMAVNGTYPIVVSGATAPAGSNYNEIVYENGTLTVSTKPSSGVPSYTIKIDVVGQGTVDPDGGNDKIERVKKNADQTFTFDAAYGYEIADVLVNGESVGAVDSYKFENVTSNQTLKVVYEKMDAASWKNPFIDVASSDWFYRGVACVNMNDLMIGTTDTTFSPYDNTTRSMVWMVLARMADADLAGGDLWYSKAQDWAMAEDVSDGTYPDDFITREQFVTMLWRNENCPTIADYAGLAAYTDVSEISDYAELAMVWGHAQGLIEGNPDQTLNPKGEMTRAEMAVILCRYITND